MTERPLTPEQHYAKGQEFLAAATYEADRGDNWTGAERISALARAHFHAAEIGIMLRARK